MSDLSRCPSTSSSIHSNISSPSPNSNSNNDNTSDQHPLSTSSEIDHPVEIFTRVIQGEYPPRRRPPSIRSIPTNGMMSRHRKTQSSFTPSSRTSNDRNLIFDDWITSTAHPMLAVHSLIPPNIVDDERAVQNMLAEAMNEEHFGSVPLHNVPHEEVRSSTPASAVDVPVRNHEVDTRPRSSSSLSMRKWAGIFVGKGDSARRPGSSSGNKTRLSQQTQQRSSSAPDQAATTDNTETSPTSDDTKGI